MIDPAAPEAGMVPASLREYRYRPRRIEAVGVRSLGRWRAKGTVITVRGTAAHFEDVVNAAWDQAARLLAAIPDRGGDAGVAFLVIHLGRGGVWLLLDWWDGGDTLMQRHFHAALDDPTRFADVAPRHVGPSLWELAVQAHERDAWLRHVLANPAGPDVAAYLADGLNGSV